MPTPSDPGAPSGRRRLTPWVWPFALAMALAAWHLWDAAFRGHGTGLRVALVTTEQARAALAADPRAITLDVRLHGETHPLSRAKRVPYMQLVSRMHEMERHRSARVFVLGASEEQGLSAAALLARRHFKRVAVVRIPPSARARAAAPVTGALTSKDGLISLNDNAKAP